MKQNTRPKPATTSDPDQRLDIICAHCGIPIDFRDDSVYVNGPSYVCIRHAQVKKSKASKILSLTLAVLFGILSVAGLVGAVFMMLAAAAHGVYWCYPFGVLAMLSFCVAGAGSANMVRDKWKQLTGDRKEC